MAIILDPLIATGSTAVAALDILKEWGCRRFVIIGAVASRTGLNSIRDSHPECDLVVGVIDETLDERGYVVPGLGDIGSRLFGNGN